MRMVSGSPAVVSPAARGASPAGGGLVRYGGRSRHPGGAAPGCDSRGSTLMGHAVPIVGVQPEVGEDNPGAPHTPIRRRCRGRTTSSIYRVTGYTDRTTFYISGSPVGAATWRRCWRRSAGPCRHVPDGPRLRQRLRSHPLWLEHLAPEFGDPRRPTSTPGPSPGRGEHRRGPRPRSTNPCRRWTTRTGTFDLVFSHSVFTHIDEHYQDELARPSSGGWSSPAGYVVLSIHGETAFTSVRGGGGRPRAATRA